MVPSVALAADPPATEPVSITLNETITAVPGVIRINSIGTIRGGTARQRAQIGRIDVAEINTKNGPVFVTRKQIEIRLALAGIEDVSINGSEEITISAVTNTNAETKNLANSPVLVRPKQRVTMTVRILGGEVSAVGEAQEEGRLGQIIKLKNIDTMKPLVGKVVGTNAVEIETGGRQ